MPQATPSEHTAAAIDAHSYSVERRTSTLNLDLEVLYVALVARVARVARGDRLVRREQDDRRREDARDTTVCPIVARCSSLAGYTVHERA